ncbi:MAG: hypothetical protein ACYC1M_15120 [Armatimonadota bacterium]
MITLLLFATLGLIGILAAAPASAKPVADEEPEVGTGHPVCHVLICCRSTNRGIKFLVNGQWNPAHDYGDISQFWDAYKPMVDNIQQVCREKQMQFFLFIGAAGDMAFWNEKAKYTLENWAKDKTYRRYGNGDDRPMLIIFNPAEMWWPRYNSAPAAHKTYLSRFHMGTTQVNDPILPGKSDGWGYRNYSQSADGKVRFVAPTSGVAPSDPWRHISGEQWRKRIAWALKADHYMVFGSYDDVCDGINWGIADTSGTTVEYNKYPGDDPYVYYKILQEMLADAAARKKSR